MDVEEPLMTQHELDLSAKLGALMPDFRAIMGDEVPNDMFEVMLHVHALQNMVMSTAARRAYPDQFRMLGIKPPWAKHFTEGEHDGG